MSVMVQIFLKAVLLLPFCPIWKRQEKQSFFLLLLLKQFSLKSLENGVSICRYSASAANQSSPKVVRV